MKSIPLHVKILIGLVLGVLWGIISVSTAIPSTLTTNYIEPIGSVFIALLKMVAMPLVLASLIVGVASMNDFNKLSRIGGRTIAIYIGTTMMAITVGLLLVNIVRPGVQLPDDTRNNLMQLYAQNVASSLESASTLEKQSPLQPIVDIVPENLFSAMTSNTQMLQVVFFALIFGIALVRMSAQKKDVVVVP